MKTICILLLSLFAFSACQINSISNPSATKKTSPIEPSERNESAFRLSKAVLQNQNLTLIEHTEDRPFGSYLAMNIQYEPVKKLLEQLESRLNLSLKNRGEAHITVITPPEFDHTLKQHLSIQEIHQIAKDYQLQKSSFQIICLGKGLKNIDSKEESTYFVVVSSPDLVQIRREIQKQFEKKGGKAQAFKAEGFSPHITVGFSVRDLHLSDGVQKDKSSCFQDIQID